MSSESSFQGLIDRVRSGDPQAAFELVRQYEPEIRRAVRIRLQDPQMQRVFDSMDICQSVMGNFFARVAVGQFELDQPEQLLKLLVRMARNKVIDKARQMRADRRDQRRMAPQQSGLLEAVAAGGDTPSQVVAGREIVEAVQRLLAPDIRYLAEQRALGRDWAELARELGSTPEALRKKLSRAIDHAAQQLGLDSTRDD
jgi:RNA polymerase sigma-70 factor (ECF subfamily)